MILFNGCLQKYVSRIKKKLMGTTLMNLHVPGTNDCVLHEYIEELYIKSIRKPAEHQILEKVVTGCFSERFVSAFFDEFEQNILKKQQEQFLRSFPSRYFVLGFLTVML